MKQDEYFMPTGETIEDLAQHTCREWAEHVDRAYDSHDTVRGLAVFFKVVAGIYVKHFNRKRQVEARPVS